MSTHQEPTYSDAIAVVAGLKRLIRDMADLRAETIAVDWQPLLPELDALTILARASASELRQDLRWNNGRLSAITRESLGHLQAKFSYLASQVEGIGVGGQEAIHRQLAWLAGDVERMRAALAQEEKQHGS